MFHFYIEQNSEYLCTVYIIIDLKIDFFRGWSSLQKCEREMDF